VSASRPRPGIAPRGNGSFPHIPFHSLRFAPFARLSMRRLSGGSAAAPANLRRPLPRCNIIPRSAPLPPARPTEYNPRQAKAREAARRVRPGLFTRRPRTEGGMDLIEILKLLGVVVLVAGNAFFVSSEIALASARRS